MKSGMKWDGMGRRGISRISALYKPQRGGGGAGSKSWRSRSSSGELDNRAGDCGDAALQQGTVKERAEELCRLAGKGLGYPDEIEGAHRCGRRKGPVGVLDALWKFAGDCLSSMHDSEAATDFFIYMLVCK